MFMMKQAAISMADGLKAGAGAGMQLGQERGEKLVKEFEAKELEEGKGNAFVSGSG
jgi:hypothetical protein